jgi:hypothetical protein
MQEIAKLLHMSQEHLDVITKNHINSPISRESSIWVTCLNRVARLVGGGRVILCKDGLDLTSMASTLEFAHLLRENHQVQNIENITTSLRMRGVRLDNVQKNTYNRIYSTILRENLAQPYKPPIYMSLVGRGQ